jgi:hypothetical protein
MRFVGATPSRLQSTQPGGVAILRGLGQFLSPPHFH